VVEYKIIVFPEPICQQSNVLKEISKTYNIKNMLKTDNLGFGFTLTRVEKQTFFNWNYPRY
jgi:hypothetical protein